MAKEPKMKIGIGADTGDFEKGARKVKQEMKDLDKVSSDALAAIGSAVGVDTKQLQLFTSAVQGLGSKFAQVGTEGATAFGNILKAVGPIAGVIAGLGIGAATAAFKLLNSEAEAFKNTVEGASIDLATAAYIETFRSFLHDLNKETGKNVAEQQAEWKKTWAEAGAFLQQFFTSGTFFNPMKAGGLASGIQEATDAATKAQNITNNIYYLERKRKEQAVEIAKINAEIADQLAIARDNTQSVAARQQAINRVDQLIEEKKKKQVKLEQDIAYWYERRSKLAPDDLAAADATLAQQQRAWEVERAITTESNSLLKIKNSIAKAAKDDADAVKKEADNIARIKADLANLNITMPRVEGSPLNNQVLADVKLNVPQVEVLNFKSMLQTEFAGMTVEVGLELDSEKLNAIAQQAAEGFKSALTNVIVSLSESIGQLIGDLATGKDGWGDFTNSAISAFGDMAIAIGKIAIEAGTSCLAIKAALNSLSPAGAYLAIAAGAALVALGSAVKAGMANVANGNYSSSMGSYSSTSSSMVSDYEGREVTVNVTGTLQADGDQLVAVINNSNKKSYYTT